MRRSPFVVVAFLTALIGLSAESSAFADNALLLIRQLILAAADSDPVNIEINPYTLDGVRTSNLIGGTMGIFIDPGMPALVTSAVAIETNLSDALPPGNPKAMPEARPHRYVALLDGSLKPATLRLADDQWAAFWPVAPSVMPMPLDDAGLSSANQSATVVLSAGEV
jgi:hypothetical protein